MIKAFSACTAEIDNVEFAVKEIVHKLDFEGKLMKNTVGILSCFADFIDTGVVKSLCRALPFDVIGVTTIAGAGMGQWGETVLCVLVLTSDDTEFVTYESGPVHEDDPSVLRRAYDEAVHGREGRPSFALGLFPLLFNIGIDFFVDSMDEITGKVPIFGALSVDHNEDYHESQVIFNGEASRDRCAFLLFYGDVEPRFYTGTISKETLLPDEGTVTASKGNLIQSVDGRPVVEYLLSLGLTRNENGEINGINSFPITIDYKDGTDAETTSMFAMTPEGYAVCAKRVPAGSKLTIGKFLPKGIVAIAANTLAKTLDGGQCQAMLIFSCVGRYFSLLYDHSAEMEMVVSAIEGRNVPYLMAYCGGEACPVYSDTGKLSNRAHSNTFIVCAF